MKCPRCDESLGLIRAEDAKVGSLWKHRCGAILVITVSGPGPHMEMREATPEEQK